MHTLWEKILAVLRETGLSETAIDTWFSDCVLTVRSDTDCVLRAGSELKRQVIAKRYAALLNDALRQAVGRPGTLEILGPSSAAEPAVQKPMQTAPGRYRFEDFTVGASNEFAYRAALAAAGHPGRAQNNPLLLFGGSGLGKTHLLSAVGGQMLAARPDANVLQLTGEAFVSGLVSAIRTRSTEEFRARFRGADLLLVDNVEILAGKAASQEEFFSVFNELYENGRQIVMTSARPPRELAGLEERLRTRFEGGLMAGLLPPDYDTRTRLLREKSGRLGLALSEAQISAAAERLNSNVRQIEGLVNSLAALTELCGGVLTERLFAQTLQQYGGTETAPLSPEAILTETARCFSLTPDALRGRSQTAAVTRARQISMYLIRTQLGLPFSEVGRLHGGRNYSTVKSSVRKIEAQLETDAALSGTLEEILMNVKER